MLPPWAAHPLGWQALCTHHTLCTQACAHAHACMHACMHARAHANSRMAWLLHPPKPLLDPIPCLYCLPRPHAPPRCRWPRMENINVHAEVAEMKWLPARAHPTHHSLHARHSPSSRPAAACRRPMPPRPGAAGQGDYRAQPEGRAGDGHTQDAQLVRAGPHTRTCRL